MHIVIMECLTGNTLSFDDVKLTDTVHDLKRRIYKATGFECTVHLQRLIRGGKVMEDYLPMSDYGGWVVGHNTVHLSLRIAANGKPSFLRRARSCNSGAVEMEITVVSHTGSKTLKVMPYLFVEELKIMMHEYLGTPMSTYYLIFRGKPLKDGRTLADYGVTEQDTIHLTLPIHRYRQRSTTDEDYKALVYARQLSRRITQGAPVDYQAELSVVARNVNGLFALLREHPKLCSSGNFGGRRERILDELSTRHPARVDYSRRDVENSAAPINNNHPHSDSDIPL